MDILEFAETICPNQLTEFQQDILARYEYSRKNDINMKIYGPRNGKTMIAKIINEWESENL